MPDIVLSTSNPCSNGDHRTITGRIDGVSVTERFHNDELNVPFTDEERLVLLRLTCRALRRAGVPIGNFAGRILRGEEATNVKFYQLIGAGSAITKTNIGTAYTNILTGLNGQRCPVDFTGCTQYRLVLAANLIGTGQWGARVVRDSDVTDVLHDSPNIGASGERELDSGWQNLPAWAATLAAQADGLAYVRIQGKSQTAADDPVFRSALLGLR